MTRLLEGVLKKHFLWKDRPLSRRGFFAVLLPFSRKDCRLCGEEKRVVGDLCPTCAKRRLQTLPGDPT